MAPQISHFAVFRAGLVRRLDEAVRNQLTLLVAPPGYGKSMLLAQWAATNAGRHVAWLTLDAADGNAVTFPVRDESGALVNVKRRFLSSSAQPKSMALARPAALYPVQALAGDPRAQGVGWFGPQGHVFGADRRLVVSKPYGAPKVER